MPNGPHIVIIGAGLIGLSTAEALCARGAQVTVLDAQGGPALGASFSNSGMIHPSQAWPWFEGDEKTAKAVLKLAERSASLIKKNCDRLDVSRGQGCYQIFDTAAEAEKLSACYDILGVQAETRTVLERTALYFPDDGFGNAYDYACALQAALARQGVVFRFGVRDLHVNKALHVTLEGDRLTCDAVVIAAGLGSADLLKPLGIDLPLQGLRGHALNFDRPDAPLPDAPIMHAASRSALTVFERHVRLSGTVGEDNPEVLREIWRSLAPDIIDLLGAPTYKWTADRPMSALGCPFMCETSVKGLWVNTGHGHMGWTLCAGSGALMADMVMQGVEAPQFAF